MGTPSATPVDGIIHGAIIGNRVVVAASGATVPVIDPSDGVVFAHLTECGQAEVDLAVSLGRAALETGEWGAMPAFERGRLLMRLSHAITANAAELAAIESRDTGKPARQAQADITAAARYFEFYAGAADKLHGETIPYLNGFFVATEREPHGVVAHIIPWNYPAQMFGRNVAPSLAVGNAVVVKPAEDACLSVLRMAQLATEVGFPVGALAVVPGRGAPILTGWLARWRSLLPSCAPEPRKWISTLARSSTARNTHGSCGFAPRPTATVSRFWPRGLLRRTCQPMACS